MENSSMKTVSAIFFLLFGISLNGFAQDSTQWDLPEDATKRVGKGWITQIQYSPDGTRLAVASSIGIWIYDTETLEEVALLSAHTEEVTALAYSIDGSVLASGSWDATIRLWNPETSELLHTLEGHWSGIRSIDISSDSNTLASASYYNTIRFVGRTHRRTPADAFWAYEYGHFRDVFARWN